MPAGGVAGDGDAVTVRPELGGVMPDPGDGGADLPDYFGNPDLGAKLVVDDDGGCAARHSGVGDEAEILGTEGAPVAAVDEDVDRRVGCMGREDVEILGEGRAIATAQP